MPSPLHETLLELFRARPELTAHLLAEPLGVAVPVQARARLSAAEVVDLEPAEYRADAVVVLEDARGVARLAAVVEAQTNVDPDKRWSWPVYVAGVRARLRCPVLLPAVCPRRSVARWAAQPLEFAGSVP